MKKTEFFKTIETVEHYDLLKNYNWIDDFLKIPEVQKQVSDLQIKRQHIEGLSMSMQEKELKLLEVDKKLAELKIEMNRLSPAVFFLKQAGRVIGDIRKIFIRNWQDLQAQMSEPCGPLGYALSKSSKAEQKAWDKLCLFQNVNPGSKFVPGEK